MGILKKIWFTFLTVTLMAMFLPTGVVLSEGETRIEVNDGNPIVLNPGQTVVAYSQVDDDTGFVESTGYRVRVKNLPAFGSGDGLGTFDFLITWDPDVISVDNATQYAGLAGWAVTPGAIDAEAGTMIINGFSGSNPRTTDTTLFYIGLTAATDNPGGTCELGITIVDFQDTTGEESGEIEPRVVVPAVVTITEPQLVSLDIVETSLDVPAGTTQKFTAMATYDVGDPLDVTATATWESSNPTYASSLTGGEFFGETAGIDHSVTVTATLGEESDTATLNIIDPILDHIEVTPVDHMIGVDRTVAYNATGIYSNGATDITDLVTWSSDTPGVATIVETTGVATGVALGETTITADLDGTSNSTTLTVATSIVVNDGNPINLVPGESVVAYSQVDDDTGFVESTGYRVRVENLPAFGSGDGLGTFDFLITWDPDVISVDNATQYAGLAGWAVTPGAIDAEAGTMIINGFSGSNPRTTDTTLFYIGLTAATDNPGGTCELGISIVDFQDTTGEESGEIEPRVVVPAVVTIGIPVLQSIEITPAAENVPAGLTQKYTAMANYDVGDPKDVSVDATWEVSNTNYATHIADGEYKAETAGIGQTVTITATYETKQATATMTIDPAVVDHITVYPTDADSPQIYTGTYLDTNKQQFTANATYSNGVEVDVTDLATWISGTPGVATVQSTGDTTPGLATSVAVGTTLITATFEEKSDSTTLEVIAPTLETVTVDGPAVIKFTRSEQYTATANYNNGFSEDVTDQAAWSTNNTALATILTTGEATPGLATALSVAGPVKISAVYEGKTGTLDIETKDKILLSIMVTPPSATQPAGVPQQYTAMGHYDDGPDTEITGDVTWTESSAGAHAVHNGGGEFEGLIGGVGETVTITAALEGKEATATLTIDPPELTAIDVTPANERVAAGNTATFVATGTYSAGPTAPVTDEATWTTSNTTATTVTGKGTVKGNTVGVGETVTITAKIGDIEDTAQLTVDPAEPVSMVIDPVNAEVFTGGIQAADDTTYQFAAMVTYTDGEVVDESAACAWTSFDTAVATVGAATGLATSKDLGSAGTTTITATWVAEGLTATASLSTEEPALETIAIDQGDKTIAYDAQQVYTATGTYENGATGDVTLESAWSVEKPSVATVVDKDLDAKTVTVKGIAEGSTKIYAKSTGITGEVTLTVNAPALLSWEIKPINPTVIAEDSIQMRAIGTYSDGAKLPITSSINWTSNATGIADVSATGLVTTYAAGKVKITGELDGTTKTSDFTVIAKAAVLDLITVTPVDDTVVAGKTKQFTAMGSYDGGVSTRDLTAEVTWSSDTTDVVVRADGLAESYAAGVANITAKLGGIEGSTTLTVTAAEVEAVFVTPVNPERTFIDGANPKQRVQFRATGVKTDGSIVPLTDTVVWASGSGSISFPGDVAGLAQIDAAVPGGALITATDAGSGKAGTSTLTVKADNIPPVINMISPANGIMTGSDNIEVKCSVSGYPTGGVTVELNDSGTKLNMAATGIVYSRTVTLTEGRNTIVVEAIDGAGNVATSGTIEVDYSPLIPKINVITPAEGDVTKATSVLVTGNISNTSAAAQVYINGALDNETIPASPGATANFAVTVNLKEGRNTIVIKGSNGSVVGTSGVRTVVRDTTAPVIEITSPAADSYVNSAGVNVEGTIDDPDVTTANLTVNGAEQEIPVTNGAFEANIKLTADTNTITVKSWDELGNTSTTSITVNYDKTRPQVAITAPFNKLLTNQGTQLVRGTVDDATIETVTLTVNGATQTASVIDGAFSKTVTLVEGQNTLEASVTDKAGNTGKSGKVKVEVDVTPPEITVALSDPTDYMNITIKSNEKFGAEPAMVGSPTLNLSGTSLNQKTKKEYVAVADLAGPGVTGKQKVTVTGMDEAGNAATAVATFIREVITVVEGTPTEVETDTTKISVSTNTTVNNQTISVTQHTENIAENDIVSDGSAGLFLEIVADGEIKNSLEEIYVELAYDPAEIYAAGLDEATLKLYTFDTTLGKWTVEPNSGSNTTGKYVWAYIDHLSKFGAFGSAITQPTTTPTVTTPAATVVNLADTGMTSDRTLLIGTTGRVQSTVTLSTTDGYVNYVLPIGTVILDALGEPVYEGYGAVEVTDPPTSPEGTGIVSSYNMLPDGVTFDPAIVLTMAYDPATLPEGMDESELYIAWWDGTQWVALDSVVDTVANIVTAAVEHFTQFSIIGALPVEEPEDVTPPTPTLEPADFTVSDLSISPASIESGEVVTIKVLVTNIGEASGTYTVTLNLNGEGVESRDVTLNGGASQTVTFTTTGDAAGTYTVAIDELSGSYNVTEPEMVEPDTGEDVTEPEPEDTIESEPEPTGGIPGWAWALIIIAIVAVLGGAGYWWYRRNQMA